ncbi:MAG: hypothetical protein EP343_14120 [Deltaproteobacteria bacterium]|nr:MAG: hypothetical protein EP343_14120 [Deltaproteobacteria bacterium]
MSTDLTQSLNNPISLLGSGATWPSTSRWEAPTVVARDLRTLEIRQFYPLPKNREETSQFSLDLYFFVPMSFGISPESWKQDAFYRNSRVYSRLHAPSLTLSALCNMNHPLNPAGLLVERLGNMLTAPRLRKEAMTALAQMYGAELTDVIQQQARLLRKRVQYEDDPEVALPLLFACQDFCRQGLKALRNLRTLRSIAETYQGIVPSKLIASLAFAEEYGSAVLDENLSEIAIHLDQNPNIRDGAGTITKIRLTLANTLDSLNNWRRSQGFVMPDSRSYEYYAYRINLLKKEVQRSLYVNMRETKRDPFITNSAAMVAAGIAAVWAALAQVPVMSGPLFSKERLALIGAATGAYILKDRIKDWLKKRLVKKFNPWDHDYNMGGETLASVGLGAFEGRVQEQMKWKNESKLSDDIRRLRYIQRTVQGTSIELERAIHYTRLLTLTSTKHEPLPEGFGLREVVRFALDDIIRRLDEPTDTIHFYDEKGRGFQEATIPRVYHINLVLVSTNRSNGEQHRKRVRVVLNQRQILRVEHVHSEFDNPPAE